MHLITQPVHPLPCSKSAMKDNNGTNIILTHDLVALTVIETPPCVTLETRHSGFLLPCVFSKCKLFLM
jgi:hypothetical protein